MLYVSLLLSDLCMAKTESLFENDSIKIIGLFGLYRITKRPYEENPESTFTPLPRNITPLGIELDPTTGADLSSTDNK